ncbi:hypothetical protein ACIQUM_29820 [Amycolatopsis azurea]|uniref:hypothetical protein n=1 Tax=Amycolatopsis azurea TaxID=36819 RepID=UPI0038034681
MTTPLSSRRTARWSAVALLLAFVGSLLVAPAEAAPAPGIRASYATPVRKADGHVDAQATVDRLRAMNADTYAFLVNRSTDWGDLEQAFLPAAQASGLAVWVYLVPPTECPEQDCDKYLPYKGNYVAWGEAIARLSVRFPVLKAWAMDDFNANVGTFTTEYTAKMRNAARAIQPSLDFYPVVYANAVSQSFVDRYAAVIDSLILPFRDDPYRNTLWTGSLRSQLDQIVARLAGKSRKAILMVYASTLSSTTITPDVEYVRTVTAVGMEYAKAGKLAGVIQYALPLTPGRPQSGDERVAHTGNSALVFTVHPSDATTAGDYAAASATVRLDSGSTSCRMVVWHTDDRPATSPAGYHAKQAIVGGTQVWERDVATEGTDWYTSSPIDLTPRLTGGAAALTLRLYEKKAVTNYSVTARMDDITLTGCHVANPGFEADGGWTYSRKGGNVLAGRHTYDAAYSTSVHAAVGSLYGS